MLALPAVSDAELYWAVSVSRTTGGPDWSEVSRTPGWNGGPGSKSSAMLPSNTPVSVPVSARPRLSKSPDRPAERET